MDPVLHREAAQRGLTPDQLRTKSFVQPVHGASMSAALADDLRERCRTALLVLPAGSVITHLTAGRLRGWWLPRLSHEPVIACTDGDAPHLDRRGVYVRRCRIPPRHRTEVDGVAIASPEWTLVELAETLSLVDLVVAIDSALHLEHTTVDLIRAALVPGRRGVRTLRKALLLCDGRSESAGETVLRLVHTLSGIPVDVQAEYRDERGEVLVALDLRVRGTNYAPEYDGAVHRDAPTHRRDLRRERILHQLGIRRAGYTMVEVRELPTEIVRLATEALGRHPNAFSATDARAEIGRSSLTRAGMQALEKRLQRFARRDPPRRK